MHPRDFFAPEDRPALEARIAEVFALGESSLDRPQEIVDAAGGALQDQHFLRKRLDHVPPPRFRLENDRPPVGPTLRVPTGPGQEQRPDDGERDGRRKPEERRRARPPRPG